MRFRENLAEDHRRLDIRSWTQRGLLYLGSEFGSDREFTEFAPYLRVKVGSDHVIVTNSCSGRPHTVIGLGRTACNYGGERAWFRCPIKECDRRVAVLFVASEIMCRTCARLMYESQYLSRCNRNIRTCQMIRLKLGGSANLMEPFPEKPKGMRRARYFRLWERASQAESVSWSALGDTLSRLEKSLLPPT